MDGEFRGRYRVLFKALDASGVTFTSEVMVEEGVFEIKPMI